MEVEKMKLRILKDRLREQKKKNSTLISKRKNMIRRNKDQNNYWSQS